MTPRRVEPAALRSVHLVTTAEVFKALYYDSTRGALQPNLVFVDRYGSVVFETNEVGLKGDPIDAGRKLAVVWGDSVVFSDGPGWPCLIDGLASGYQFLNGGLEGDLYGNILWRAGEFNRRHRVTLNLVMLGWHPFLPLLAEPPRRGWFGLAPPEKTYFRYPGNRGIRRELTEFLERVPNTVMLTMPTALNPRILDCDLSSLLIAGDDDDAFRFVGNVPYRLEGQRQGFEHILERNAITREVCARLGVRLVDLFAAFDTSETADFREHFIDMIHFRKRANQTVAQFVFERIEDLLA